MDGFQLPGQMSIFDIGKERYKITKPIRLIELFAGVGSQAMALRNIGANFERWKVVEFDKYAIKSYNAIHSTNFPTLDITKINGQDLEITEKEKYCYIMFYSFPCTDLSVAGAMKGMQEGSGTRSALLWEVKRLLEELGENIPQILIMENVPQVHSKTNMPHFQKWLDYLDSKGYSTSYKDLNAKNFGVAQSRNRTFCVSILGNYTYEFPEEIPLQKTMKDYLEDEVDERFYITSQKAKELIDKLVVEGKILTDRQTVRSVPGDTSICAVNTQNSFQCVTPSKQDTMLGLEISSTTIPESLNASEFDKWKNPNANFVPYDKAVAYPLMSQEFPRTGFMDIAPTLAARDYKDPKVTVEVERLGGMSSTQSRTVYDSEGLSPTLTASMGPKGNTMPYITEVDIVAMRGRDKDNPSDRTKGNPNLEQRLEINSQRIANTLTTVQKDNIVLEHTRLK